MKRRTLPAATALTATAALLLTACGGDGDESADKDKIAGAEKSADPTPTPSASPSDSVQRPEIILPNDMKNVFENWKAGKPVEDAVLSDASQQINATDAAIAAADPDSAALGFYLDGDALVGAADWVKGYVDGGNTFTGTTRYFKPELEIFDKDTAGLAYCSDESKAFDKNRKTGKVKKTAVTDKSYVTYSTRLEKNDKGVWQTTSLQSERGNAKCTP
ncbi:hypothetical protein ACIQNU_29770 [Streptomyces sp. NPDC091292]|uniref:hypothetical protein n=1 Tax=Streptomyces sp. NPDC091292 TaxID=3365991 RepID=UPI0038199E67